MNIENFVILLIVFLVIFCVYDEKENFNTNSQGLYNWFYGSYMNPYSQSLNKFYSNDKEGVVNLSE